jgi:hypothetical protein
LSTLIAQAKDEKLVCSVCRKATSSRIAVPINYGLRDVIAVRNAEKDLPSGVPCDECLNRIDVAIMHCSECLLWLCELHVSNHRNAKSTFNHELLTAEEKIKHRTSSPLGKAKCHVHADQVVALFCKTHDIAICDRCGMLDHKGCTLCNVTDAELLRQQKSDLQKLFAEAPVSIQRVKTTAATNRAFQSAAKHSIATLCDNLVASITSQKQALMQAEEKALADAIQQAELMAAGARATLAETEQLLHSNQLLRLLAMKPQLKQALQPDIASCKKAFADAFCSAAAPLRQVHKEMLANFQTQRIQILSTQTYVLMHCNYCSVFLLVV